MVLLKVNLPPEIMSTLDNMVCGSTETNLWSPEPWTFARLSSTPACASDFVFASFITVEESFMT